MYIRFVPGVLHITEKNASIIGPFLDSEEEHKYADDDAREIMTGVEASQKAVDLFQEFAAMEDAQLAKRLKSIHLTSQPWNEVLTVADFLCSSKVFNAVCAHLKQATLFSQSNLLSFDSVSYGKRDTDLMLTVVILEDGRVACGCNDGSVLVLSNPKFEVVARMTEHESSVYALAVLPGNRLASGGREKDIKIWDTHACVCVGTLTGHSSFAWAWTLATLPNGHLASGCKDGVIAIWDTVKLERIKTLSGHSGAITSLAVLPDGRLASGGGELNDTKLRLWNTTTGERTSPIIHGWNVFGQMFATSDGHFVAQTRDQVVKIWTMNDWEEDTFRISDDVRSITPVMDCVAVCVGGRQVSIFNTNRKLKTSLTIEGIYLSMAAFPDGTLIGVPGNHWSIIDVHTPKPTSEAALRTALADLGLSKRFIDRIV